ncbi:MAG: glycerophosphodiester phosphodiesterase, partial [Promethearchaeota archaeon]
MVFDSRKRPSNWEPLYIGHRGFRIGVVENTLTAFQKALEFEMDYIKLEIHRSKDNILYVLNDSDISRTMRARGIIEEKLSGELDQVMTYTLNDILPRLTTVFAGIFTP